MNKIARYAISGKRIIAPGALDSGTSDRNNVRMPARIKAYFKEWIQYRGLTQNVVADRMADDLPAGEGGSRENVNRIINDKHTRGWDNRHLAAFAKAVDADPIDILREPGAEVIEAFGLSRDLVREVLMDVELGERRAGLDLSPARKTAYILALCEILDGKRREDGAASLTEADFKTVKETLATVRELK